MNELEKYTASIPDSNPQKAELIRQWKVDNEWGKPVVEEAVKTEVVVEEDAPATTTPEASENLNSGDGQLESLNNNDPDLPSDQTLNINVGTQDVKAINNAVEKAMVIDAQTALENSEILFRENYDVFDPDGDGEAGQIGLEERKSNVGIVKAGEETEDDKLVRSFIEATDLQKNQFDDLYASIYDNEDLFAVTEVTSGGGGSSMTGYMPTTTTTVTANALKLQEAEDQLNEKVRKGEPKPTKEQIEYRARQNMFNTQARELKMSNARDFIFNIPEYKEDDEGNVLKDEDGNKIKNRSEKQNIIADFIVKRRDIATWTVEDFGKELALDLGEFKDSKLLKATKASKEAIEKRQDEIKTLQETILQKRKKGESTLEEVSKYKELTAVYKDLIKYYNGQTLSVTNQKVDLENRITDYTNMIADLDDSGVQLDALSRVYDKFEKRWTDLALGSYGVLFANPAAFLEKVGNYLDDTGGEDETFFQDQVKQLAEVKEFVANKYYQPISFKDAFKSLDNFGEFAIDQSIQQAPIITALYTGQGGIYALGMGTAAEYDAGRKLESEKDGGRSYDKDIVFLQSLGFGAAEAVFGAAPTALILRGTLRGANDFGRRKLLDGWKNYFRNIKTNAPLDIGLIGADAGGEWTTNVFQNFIDGRPANQGGLEAFTVGGMFGSVFTGMPYFKGAFAAALSDYKTNSDVRANLKIIEILSRSAQNPLLTKAEKERDAAMKQKLIDQNNEISKERIDLATNNLNKQGGDLLAETTVRQEQLRVEAESVQQNNSLDSETKNKLINDLNTEFDALENAADKFKVAFTNTFGLLTKKKQKALKDEAERFLQIDNPGNPSKEQINRKAEQLHTKEKLEATLESDQATLKALAGAGIDVNYNVSDTNTGAIEEFTKMMLARAADPNNSITKEGADDLIKEFTEGIKDGTLNGFNVPSVNVKTGKKVYDVVTSVQNSVANERSKTQLHELGHIIATEAIGTDPAAFEELKDLILSYVKETNPEAHTRIIARTLNQNADEVMMVFFEEVADTRIDLKKAKGTGFLGYFGKMLGIATSKASNTDYDYNFNGEEDILAFAFEMATKLKNGTLTIEDVKDIQDKDYVVPDEVDMKMVNEEVVITAKSKKGKASKETTFTPEQITPEQKTKNKQLVQKIVDGDFSAINTLVQDNAGLILGPKVLGFNQDISKNSGVTSEDLLNVVQDILTPGLANLVMPGRYRDAGDTNRTGPISLAHEYNAKKGEVSTFLGLLGLRKADIYTAAGLDPNKFNLVDIDFSTTQIIDEDSGTKPSKGKEVSTKQTDATSFGPAKNKKQDLENIIQIKDADRFNFKSLNSKYFNEVAEILFNMSGKKVRGNASLKYKDVDGRPISAEANILQNLFKSDESVRSFIKTMPKYNVATIETIINEKGESIDVSRDVYGRAIGINPKILEVFYDKVTTAIPGISNPKGRSLGKTTQPPVYKIKPEFDAELGLIGKEAIVKLQNLVGVTPKGELSLPVKGPARTEFGSTLTGLSKMYVDNVINTIGRSKLDSKQAKADAGAGKPKSMASREVQADAVNIFLENQSFEKTTDELAVENKQWKFMAKTIGVRKLDSKNPNDVAEMQAWVRDVLAPNAPKSLFTNGTFANAGISAAKRNFFFTSGMTLQDGSIGQLGELLKDAVFAPESVNIAEAVRKQTYVTGGRYGKISESFIKEFNSAKFKKKQQQKLDGLKEVFKIFETLMKKDKKNAAFIIALLSSTSQGMGHFVRTAAPVKFYAKDVSSGIVEEHTMPASLVAKYLFNLAYAGKIDTEFSGIEKNYFQGALPYADDKKLKGIKPNGKPFNYTVMTPEGWKISDNIWARYFNLNVGLTGGGIDPKNIVLSNGKTVFETYSITSTGFKLNPAGKASREKANALTSSLVPKGIEYTDPQTTETFIKALIKTDESLANARKLNPEVVKAYVMDLDDTLLTSKSNVLYTMPNFEGGFSEGSTKLKAIFMVGGPGAGKTNVGKGLQLGRRGYKVVNQDIALEAMKKESGLPAEESNYTAEQRSTRSKLGAAARKAAVAKFDEYAANGDGMVIDGTGASYEATTKKIKALQDLGYEVHMVVANTPLETALERNRARTERSLPDFIVQKTYDQVQESLAKYRKDFGGRLYEINTEAIKYGKPLPGDFLEVVYKGINANKVGKINATEFAKRAGILEAQGAKFDFTEFEKIIEGKKGPLFKVLENINAKRGTKDFYILTARPAAAAPAIKKFLEALGISVPLKNITGLGDGKPEAKAGWFVGMAAKGYNDFYFADDHFGNVKAVKEILNVLDVKGKVQLAKASKEATFDIIVNDMIQDSSGIEAYKKYSAARAKTIGAGKGKYNFLIAPSAEDFTGLLYKMLGKGKRGDAQMAFLKTNLLDPYDRAESAVTQAKIAAANDFKALKTQLTTLPTSLSVPTGIGGFTYSHAVRVAIWTMQGMEVPGLSKRDTKELNDFIKNDAELQAFVNELIVIQKGKPYPKPGKDWLGGNITTDIINNINKVNRAEYQQEWRENIDIIFSEANLNKMEAAYGTRWREALEDSIRRMKAGSNRPIGGNRTTEALLDWLNNSVGAVMFLNTRSALLQTLSMVNFINWGDNNIAKAGAAFANQKQFWSDFMTLMNSDYLVERRNGLKINVSESEIADAVRDSGNKVKAAIAFLLSKGFVMTRFADSFAIAAGGSTFYRNRVKSLVAKGMDQKAAEAQAFEDFRQIAEESQQSSNPNKISMQQASGAGRVILAWANTPMQYARIQKRAGQDLINGRGDWKTNVSKIVYYGAIQNLIFNALQSAVFALGFGEDDEDKDAKKNEKISKIANGMIDSQLKGLGIFGAASVALKNTLMTLYEEHGKKGSKYENAIDDLLSFSPPLGSKIGKIKGGLRSFSWNMEDMKEKGFSLDNPAYLAGAQIVTGLTNLPLDRVMKKINNIRGMVNERSALWQKVALGLGWSTWELGLGYYGGFDAAKVLTPDEQLTKEVNDMKKLTKTKEQVDMLLDFGLTKKEIKALGKEDLRVRKIIELQKKDKK